MNDVKLEVLPRDLSPYCSGNVGIDYVHRFDSGVAGPHVVVNALTHGNEFCGMTAVTDLLDRAVRPKRGVLTLCFSNVAAYESFNPARPFESRQIVHNFNRIWSDQQIDGHERSPELDRARQLRPVFARADHLLDLHSTSQDVVPFWVYQGLARHGSLALSLRDPFVHLVMPRGLGSGAPIIQYGRFGDADAQATALVAECGQHFLRKTSELAKSVTAEWLVRVGVLDAADREPAAAVAAVAQKPMQAQAQAPPQTATVAEPHRRFELLATLMVKTKNFKFTGSYQGFESFVRGAIIATDGDETITAPCDDCTILMPTRAPIVGREAVYLARPLS